MSPLSINHVFRQIPTTLDLNGPYLSFTVQPTSKNVCDNGTLTLTATADEALLNNPTKTPTGTISYRWYEAGVGALSNGGRVSGATSNTLNITGMRNPADNGRRFYVQATYTPSAYSSGTTGNAIPTSINSTTVTATVYPDLTITDQPDNTTATRGNTATFTVAASASDGSAVSYQWQESTNNVNWSNISGARSTTLNISKNTDGTYYVRAVITHPTACESPLTSNSATFTVVAPRRFIVVEYMNSTTATIVEHNLADGPITIPRSTHVTLHASEQDLDVFIEMYGSGGISHTGLGGAGGYSKLRLTLQKEIEHCMTPGGIASAPTFGYGSITLYRRSTLLAVVGAGGNGNRNSSGTGYNGGRGGGVNHAGENGQRSSGGGQGIGGAKLANGSLPVYGIFGSEYISAGDTYERARAEFLAGAYGGDDLANIPLGGRIVECPRGNDDLWSQPGFTPCSNNYGVEFSGCSGGRSKFKQADLRTVTNSRCIFRGFKAGYGIRSNGGRGSGDNTGRGYGGDGCTGGGGGQAGAGGGGGSGWVANGVQVISSSLGGGAPRDTNGYMVISLVNP